jgi:hypothetical protein
MDSCQKIVGNPTKIVETRLLWENKKPADQGGLYSLQQILTGLTTQEGRNFKIKFRLCAWGLRRTGDINRGLHHGRDRL